MQCGSMRIKRSKRSGKLRRSKTVIKRTKKGIKRVKTVLKRSKSSKRSKKRSLRGSINSKCREYLQDKIKKNMKELKKGRWVSRAQAVAVSYSQVKKSHPECKRSLAKRSAKKKRSNRK